ncbi:KGGVGR-motif variant AAA ATPase [Aliiroseovarius sp. 2305UL8-7]|uniref:KGGVGR-motif variant AAA ATPase n=1 Tax=Aliiroseovarius conchicola TaxID=3121637 RepID=UPI003528A2EE
MSCPIIAFYGFKGGAGRSFLLANTAAFLAAAGKRVLVMDVDLEAPGLGDFFDDRVDQPRGGQGVLGDAWRQKRGYIDLIREEADPSVEIGEGQKAEANRTKMVAQNIAAKLRLAEDGALTEQNKDYLTKIDPPVHRHAEENALTPPAGSLVLLGPGSLKSSVNAGSLNYVSNLLAIDIGARVMDRQGRTALNGLKLALQEMAGYDFVLIDGRTGYNANSIATIQNLATSVVLVSTPAMQSIEGMARVSTLFTGLNPSQPLIKPRLVLLKATGTRAHRAERDRREVALWNKRKVIDAYFNSLDEEDIYDFPFIDDFVTGESFMFRRGNLREMLHAAEDATTEDNKRPVSGSASIALRRYCDELLRLLNGVVDVSADGDTAPFTSDTLHTAFDVWRRSDHRKRPFDTMDDPAPKRSKFAEAMNDASKPVDVLKYDSETYVKRFLMQTRLYLRPASDGPSEAGTDVATQTRREEKSVTLSKLKQAYANLYLEERALALTRLDSEMQRELAGGAKQTSRYDEIDREFLSILPNRRPKGFGRLEGQHVEIDADVEVPEPAVQISTTHEVLSIARDISDRCREVALLSDDQMEEVIGRIDALQRSHPNGRPAKIAGILRQLALANTEGTETNYTVVLRQFNELVADKDQGYLPKSADRLQGARDWNLIDVVERRLIELINNGHLPEMSDIILATAQTVMSHFLQAVPRQGFDARDVARTASYMYQWIKIWSQAATAGTDIGSAARGYPDRATLTKIRAFTDRGPLVTDMNSEEQVTLNGLIGICALICGNNDEAHAAMGRMMALILDAVQSEGPRETSEMLLLALDLAYKLENYEDSWKLQRLREGALSFDPETVDIDDALAVVTVGQQLGVGFLMPVGPGFQFQTLPVAGFDDNGHLSQVQWINTSDQEDQGLGKRMAWFHATYLIERGLYKSGQAELVLGTPTSLRTTTLPLSFTGSWLMFCQMEVGEFDGLEALFDSYWASSLNRRWYRSEDLDTYFKTSSYVLKTALAAGNLDAFDKFEARTRVSAGKTLGPRIEVAKIVRDLTVLRRTALEKDYDRNIVSDRAEQLHRRLIALLPRLSASPADRQFSSLIAKPWIGMGVFSGDELPNPRRSIVATTLLDALELQVEPDTEVMAIVERMLWADERKENDSFLSRIEFALLLPRARLEVLRSHVPGLDADLDAARRWMERDLLENGTGRQIHYPDL